MKPVWLIERGVFGKDVEPFLREVKRQGMTCAEVDYRPGQKPPHDIVGCPELPGNGCALFWGTLPLMQQIHLHHHWIPGGWCNLSGLECRTYYAYFGAYLLNQFYTILPGVEAIRLEDPLFETFGKGDQIFVRPNGVHKLFTGTMASKERFRDILAPTRYDPETLVVVSSPRVLQREWRLIVAERKVIAGCQYRNASGISISPDCPGSVVQFAQQILGKVFWQPDPLFVMDVCESEGNLSLLELNSFSCSGFYACDLPKVIEVASDVAQREWQAAQLAIERSTC